MIRNLKALGLALVAVLAMSAVAVSAAQATETPEFTAGKGTVGSAQNVNLSGSSSASQVLDAFGTSVTCTSSSFAGTSAVPSQFATATPSYSGCSAFGTFPATVTINGCDYKFKVEKTEEGTDAYLGSAEVICPAGKFIEIDVYLSGKDEGTPSCIVKIGSQANLKQVTFKTDTGTPHDITVSGTIANISATQVRNNFLCPAGTSTTEAKETVATPVTVQARTDNAANELIDTWID